MDSLARFGDKRAVGWVRSNIGYILFGLAAAALLSVAGLVVYKGLESQRADEIQTTKSAQTARDHAGEQVKRYCVPLPPDAERDCRREVEDSYRDYYKESRDLEAQRETATWTALMGAADLIGMAISIIGVGLVFITFQATREANEIARHSLEGQLRPWIKFSIDKHARLWVKNDTLELCPEVTFKNVGSTPALDLTYMATMIFGQDVPTHFENLIRHFHTNDTDWADKTLFPNEQWPRNVSAAHSGKREGVHEISLAIIARYRTPFSKTYRFTGRVFDVGLADQNSYGDYASVGHKNIDIGILEREIVMLVERQHFSGFIS